jgi:hypothetical protein
VSRWEIATRGPEEGHDGAAELLLLLQDPTPRGGRRRAGHALRQRGDALLHLHAGQLHGDL